MADFHICWPASHVWFPSPSTQIAEPPTPWPCSLQLDAGLGKVEKQWQPATLRVQVGHCHDRRASALVMSRLGVMQKFLWWGNMTRFETKNYGDVANKFPEEDEQRSGKSGIKCLSWDLYIAYMGEFLGDGINPGRPGFFFVAKRPVSQVYDINNCKVVGVMAKIPFSALEKERLDLRQERCSFCTFF